MPLTLIDLPQTLLVDVFEAAAFTPMDQAALRATCAAAVEAFAAAAVGFDQRKLPAFTTSDQSVVVGVVDEGTPVESPFDIATAACGRAVHQPAAAKKPGMASSSRGPRATSSSPSTSSASASSAGSMVRKGPHPAVGLQCPVRACEQLHIRVGGAAVSAGVPEPVVDALTFMAFRRLRIVVDDPGRPWAKVSAGLVNGHAGLVRDQCHEIVFAPPTAAAATTNCASTDHASAAAAAAAAEGLISIVENTLTRMPELRTIRFESGGGKGGGAPHGGWAISELGDNCLSHLPKLDSVDFICRSGAARTLSAIGRRVFSACAALRDVHLDDMPSLSTIGGGVFADCGALRSLHISGVPRLTRIADNFAMHCPALEHVDLDFPAVIEISTGFIKSSPRVQRIVNPTTTAASSTPEGAEADFLSSWCPRLVCLKGEFMAGSGLTALLLQGAPSGDDDGPAAAPLQSIDTSAFANGAALREIKLMRLPNLRSVDFICNYTACPSAEFVNVKRLTLSELPSLLSLATGFASQLPALEFAELDNLRSLRSIPPQAFACCPQLKEIVMTNLHSVTFIGAQFAYGCDSLISIRLDTASVPYVDRIEDAFASSCASLTSITIDGLWHLATLGDDFARGCPKLESVSILERSNGTTVGASFAAQCPLLTRVDLGGFGNEVVSIGDRFLFRCRSLQAGGLTLPRMASAAPQQRRQPRAATIGKHCMAECASLGLPDRALLGPWQGAAIGARAFARVTAAGPKKAVVGNDDDDDDDDDRALVADRLEALKGLFSSVGAGFGFMST